MLRQVKGCFVVEAKVEYSRVVNPLVEADGKSSVSILSVIVDEADGAAIKNIAEKMIADEIVRLQTQFPRVKYERSLFYPIKPADDTSSWSLKVKRRCEKNGEQVPIFAGASNTDTRIKRSTREIGAGSTVKVSFQPTVHTYDEWGDITSVGVTFKLQAVRIMNEPAADRCYKKFTKTAADFGLEADNSDDENFEIFPGLKL